MNVTSPSQYRGAVIEGHIGSVASSGRVSGLANVSMEFDTIRLANGSSYRFAGIIDSVKAVNGDDVSVNNEGTVRDSNQTTKTVTRAGIGAVLFLVEFNIRYDTGFQLGLIAFTAAVLGGIGNLPGAMLGGLVIGLVRSLGTEYVGEQWTSALVFGILILLLVFRPTGLLGARTREKV